MLGISTNHNFVPKEIKFGSILYWENHSFQYRKIGLGTWLQFPEKSQGPKSRLSHLLPVEAWGRGGAHGDAHAPSLQEQGLTQHKASP